jgi:hypothetical protein
VTAVVYDAGALLAADRSSRKIWLQHRVWTDEGVVPSVPAPALAQVSRSPRQAQLRRLLRGCDVIALDEDEAHAVGRLLAVSGTSDITDAAVVVAARDRGATILTSDRKDIAKLLAASDERCPIVDV